ncbi:hypothetical protein ACLM5H_24595 [Fredinandcohnia humi]
MLNEKESKRLKEIIEKALSKDQGSLSAQEVKELQGLLKKLEAEKAKKKADKESLSEIISCSMDIALAKTALKENESKKFNELPLKDKIKALNEQLDKLNNSDVMKKFSKEQAEKQEQKDFENFYAEHAKKYGSDMFSEVNERDIEADSQMSDEDKAFYEDYVKRVGGSSI